MNRYSDIATFDDFRFEKERLTLKRKISETRISFAFLYLRKSFSGPGISGSILKEIIFPGRGKK
jgi:hypothetical protein